MDRKKIILRSVFLFLFITAIAVYTYFATVIDHLAFKIIVAFGFIYLINLAAAIYIINSQRHNYVKMVWIFIILTLPLIGFFLFLAIGISGLKKRNIVEFNQDQVLLLQKEDYRFTKQLMKQTGLNNLLKSIFTYTVNTSNRPIYQHNQIHVVGDGVAYFKKMLQLIEQAKTFIHIEYYVFDRGIWLETLATLLVEKVKLGVEVRIIHDWMGNLNLKVHKIWKYLKDHGVKVGVFNKPTGNPFKAISNYRCHRKILIVDNKYALYGSSNIADEYCNFNRVYNFIYDLNFYIEGEVVNTFNIMFVLDWQRYTGKTVSQMDKRMVENWLLNHVQIFQAPQPNAIIQVFENGPDFNEKTIRNVLVKAILSASSSIWIQTPYFYPSEELLNALKIAALSGVEIKMILPLKPDHGFIIEAMNRWHYQELIEAGIEIYEYQGFLHAKTILIDQEVVITGTFNLDFRALFMNFETACVISSKSLAHEIFCVMQRDFMNCKLVSHGLAKRYRSKDFAFKMSIISIFHPLL